MHYQAKEIAKWRPLIKVSEHQGTMRWSDWTFLVHGGRPFRLDYFCCGIEPKWACTPGHGFSCFADGRLLWRLKITSERKSHFQRQIVRNSM
jgi:hypothetical protein